ncbi:MAG: endonuclease/exonuclease/phosphatase family protein [Acidobacteriota bacterium]
MSIKITTWNIEHASRLVSDQPTARVLERRRRARETIEEIDPDVLCVVEGPKGEQAITDFSRQLLNDAWTPVLLKGPADALGDRDRDYQIRGSQWIWFLVKPALAGGSRLQDPTVWQAFTGSRSWQVNYWGQIAPSRHDHYRHPQVLIVDLGAGEQLEVIGLHLKSKINRKRITRDDQGNLTGDHLESALKSRAKLATEARNVRDYIHAKFNQNPSPGLVIIGDCNDGPGHDFFEKEYLFFDLVQNLQGEVLVAERFFNHALFDFPEALRWTARFRDAILNIPASRNPLLLDHILISQPLVRGGFSLQVAPNGGRVDHEAYERANAGANSKTRSSDHRPVSCLLQDSPAPPAP